MSRQALHSRLVRDGMTMDEARAKPLKAHSTVEEVEKRRDDVQALIESMEHPVTVRQVYYRAVVKEIVPKTESGYRYLRPPRFSASLRSRPIRHMPHFSI